MSDTSVESLINIIIKSYFRSVSRDVLYIDDIKDTVDFKQIKKIDYEKEIYYYNVFNYNDTDIIIIYLLENNKLAMDNVFVCGEKADYNAIQNEKYQNETYLSNLQYLSGGFVSTKISNNITKNSEVNHLFEYYTDKGFAYVGYNSSRKYIDKFLATDCVYEKLYDSYEQQAN